MPEKKETDLTMNQSHENLYKFSLEFDTFSNRESEKVTFDRGTS